MVIHDLIIQPGFDRWRDLIRKPSRTKIFGHTLADWFSKTRCELGIDVVKPVIATGHQTLLWHPGILAKYLAVHSFARTGDFAAANLIVDQHADGFGDFEIPVRRGDGSLVVRRMHLTTPQPGVPMGLHEPFTPPRPFQRITGVLPSVAEGVQLIYEKVYAHRDAVSAARQMAAALEDMMHPWVDPMPSVTASELLETTFARALLTKMADDPWHCTRCYNQAVVEHSDAGIGTLLVRDDYVELPLWRIREDGRRMHAYDGDVQMWLVQNEASPKLMPRALLLTALIRLGMCDLFVHGTGGANYDRVMEQWIESWLGVKTSSIAVVSATLHLPLADHDEEEIDIEQARRSLRRAWHDPESASSTSSRPGPLKRELLGELASKPYGSSDRRAAFFHMHERLGTFRDDRRESIDAIGAAYEQARLRSENSDIASRRTWAFPLYEKEAIDTLAQQVESATIPAGIITEKTDRNRGDIQG